MGGRLTATASGFINADPAATWAVITVPSNLVAPAGLMVAGGRQRSGRSGPAVRCLRGDAVR
jgi:hypothetical protein